MRRVPFLLVVICLGSSTSALAQVEPYLGAQYMRSGSSCQGFVDGVKPLGLIGKCPRTTDNGYRVFGGANLTRVFGVEVGYQDAGEGLADAFSGNTYVLTLTAPLTAWDVVGTVRHEIASNFWVQGHAGAARWDYQVIASSTSFGAKNRQTTFTYGFGIQYKWLIAGYDSILKVGQENLLVPNQDIKQPVYAVRVGLKYTFK